MMEKIDIYIFLVLIASSCSSGFIISSVLEIISPIIPIINKNRLNIGITTSFVLPFVFRIFLGSGFDVRFMIITGVFFILGFYTLIWLFKNKSKKQT